VKISIFVALLSLTAVACDGGDDEGTDDSTVTPPMTDPTDNTPTTTTPDPDTTMTPDDTTAGDTTTENTTGPEPALSFAADVYDPIIGPRCGCHVAGSGGLTLGGDAATALTAMLGVPSSQTTPYVTAGNSAESYVYLKVTGTGAGSQMPLGGMLSDDEIATIQAWIDGGANP
jgi:hypothetical protein